jgi:hypothetical protein
MISKMKKLLVAFITIFLGLHLLNSCGLLAPSPVIGKIVEGAQGQTGPSIPVTGAVPAVPSAQVKTSLVFMRGGQAYEVVVGYAVNPPAGFARVERAEVIWSGDINGDGEPDYLVAQQMCTDQCVEEVHLYAYDPTGNRYYAAGKMDGVAD